MSKIEKLPNSTKWLVAVALVASLLGDILLMQVKHDYFIQGLASFAVAHICYALFFNRRRQGKLHLPSLIPNIVFVGLLIFSLNQFVDIPENMVYPVNIYGALIGLNLVASVQFNFSNGIKDYWLPLGVLLFVISDYLLALNKFNAMDDYFHYLVFSTYAAAQFLIVVAVLKHFKVLKENPIDQNGSTS